MMYGQNAISVNEFLGKSWQKILPGSKEPLDILVLKSRGIFAEARWYWIGVGALVGYIFLFNVLYTLSLTYLEPLEKPLAILTEETLAERNAGKIVELTELSSSGIDITETISHGGMGSSSKAEQKRKRGMMLPFEPLSITYNDIRYAVNMPKEMKTQGVTDNRLELLKGVSGAFRPGVLTALMGINLCWQDNFDGCLGWQKNWRLY